MSTKILVAFIALCFLAGCSKDKYTAKPQLKYKGVNTKVLNRDQTITFTLQVTDAEGDLQDSLWVQEIVRNCPSGGGISRYKMPDFNAIKNFKGDIEVCYSYGINLSCPPIREPQCPGRNDSATYRFWIQDNAKNVSDTISSDEVVIVQQ
ncbi:hypothetical protein [Segetibacter koreensis]|uniref:hypothetical protein n=1 Tax=Segetibacter koreensis TaxID=398037 RepID=UPI00036205ED|nr:hypothetical protein [Segetibacter koreensis]